MRCTAAGGSTTGWEAAMPASCCCSAWASRSAAPALKLSPRGGMPGCCGCPPSAAAQAACAAPSCARAETTPPPLMPSRKPSKLARCAAIIGYCVPLVGRSGSRTPSGWERLCDEDDEEEPASETASSPDAGSKRCEASAPSAWRCGLSKRWRRFWNQICTERGVMSSCCASACRFSNEGSGSDSKCCVRTSSCGREILDRLNLG
mmetsp:Transcript_13499/g.43345  ORF Transcript_13499/g.43345 Transcript_13499/m.43345 type:complete len:205 (-) Transcript_13499:47-661(-)